MPMNEKCICYCPNNLAFNHHFNNPLHLNDPSNIPEDTNLLKPNSNNKYTVYESNNISPNKYKFIYSDQTILKTYTPTLTYIPFFDDKKCYLLNQKELIDSKKSKKNVQNKNNNLKTENEYRSTVKSTTNNVVIEKRKKISKTKLFNSHHINKYNTIINEDSCSNPTWSRIGKKYRISNDFFTYASTEKRSFDISKVNIKSVETPSDNLIEAHNLNDEMNKVPSSFNITPSTNFQSKSIKEQGDLTEIISRKEQIVNEHDQSLTTIISTSEVKITNFIFNGMQMLKNTISKLFSNKQNNETKPTNTILHEKREKANIKQKKIKNKNQNACYTHQYLNETLQNTNKKTKSKPGVSRRKTYKNKSMLHSNFINESRLKWFDKPIIQSNDFFKELNYSDIKNYFMKLNFIQEPIIRDVETIQQISTCINYFTDTVANITIPLLWLVQYFYLHFFSFLIIFGILFCVIKCKRRPKKYTSLFEGDPLMFDDWKSVEWFDRESFIREARATKQKLILRRIQKNVPDQELAKRIHNDVDIEIREIPKSPIRRISRFYNSLQNINDTDENQPLKRKESKHPWTRSFRQVSRKDSHFNDSKTQTNSMKKENESIQTYSYEKININENSKVNEGNEYNKQKYDQNKYNNNEYDDNNKSNDYIKFDEDIKSDNDLEYYDSIKTDDINKYDDNIADHNYSIEIIPSNEDTIQNYSCGDLSISDFVYKEFAKAMNDPVKYFEENDYNKISYTNFASSNEKSKPTKGSSKNIKDKHKKKKYANEKFNTSPKNYKKYEDSFESKFLSSNEDPYSSHEPSNMSETSSIHSSIFKKSKLKIGCFARFKKLTILKGKKKSNKNSDKNEEKKTF